MPEPRSCPICKRPVPLSAQAQRHRPFCSARCADIDLSRWLNGVYAIPAQAADEASEGEIQDADAQSQDPPDPAVRH